MSKTTHYIVQDAAACMPSSCWGRYRRVAVLEVDADLIDVSMISERAKGVHRVVATWEKCHVGQSYPLGRCAASKAYAEAEAMAAEMNGIKVAS